MSFAERALRAFAPAVRLDASPIVRNDACAPCSSGGSPNYGGQGFGGPGWGAVGLTREQVDVLCIDNLMSKIVHRLPEDACKIAPDLSGPTLGALDEVWDYLTGRHFEDQEFRALSYSRRYGGGALLAMVDDGRDLSEPIDLLNIRTVRGFIDLEKQQCIPGPPSSRVESGWWGPQWGRPSYFVVSSYVGGELSGVNVHPSRIIPYRHRRWLNDRQARRFAGWNGWGPGVPESIYQPFIARTEGVMRANGVIRSFGYDHVKFKGMHNTLEGPGGMDRFRNFLDFIKGCRDYTEDGVPLIVTGPDVDDIKPLSRNVSGLDKLIEAGRSFLLDYLDEPRVVIFGYTQGGLGDTASGEWQTYWQLCSAFQENVRWPGIRQAAILAMAAKDGPTSGRVDFGLTAAWESLEEENEADKAKSRKDNSEARERDSAILGIDGRTLALFDPSVEEAYPGIQAAIENGTVSLGGLAAPTEAGAEEVAAAPSPASEPDSGDVSDEAPTPPAALPSDIVTEAEARRMLKCGTATFARWVRDGKIQPFRVGNGRRYSMAEVVSAARNDSCMRMDPFPSEHAARQANPSNFAKFRRKEIAEGVALVEGQRFRSRRWEDISVRLAADLFTAAEAREWLKAHGFKASTLEPATGGRTDNDSRMDAACIEDAADKNAEFIAEAYKAYHEAVNMSASELEEWAATECSKAASLSREPITRNLRILRTPRDKWTMATARGARDTTAFIGRMAKGEQGEEVCGGWSKRDISLKNWAFDPRK